MRRGDAVRRGVHVHVAGSLTMHIATVTTQGLFPPPTRALVTTQMHVGGSPLPLCRIMDDADFFLEYFDLLLAYDPEHSFLVPVALFWSF